MTISNRFVVLLAEKSAREKRRISIAEVSRATGITPKTLQGWAARTIKRYDTQVLDALCKYFGCQPGDLLEYTPPSDGQ